MTSRADIHKEITSPDRRPDVVRRSYLKQLAAYTKRDCIIYASAFSNSKSQLQQVPGVVCSITQEDIQGFMSAVHGLKSTQLDLIIHSPGGSAEATAQIVDYLRAKYNHIRAIVPQNAMSAATMLCCACDEIIMAKHSALGPIDPQMGVTGSNGAGYFIPVQAILDEFKQAKTEVTSNPNLATLWVNRINSYPHGFFKKCEDTIKLAKTMVESWLAVHMFQGVNSNTANSIASWLSDASQHLTHGRPINLDTATSKGMIINPLEADQTLQDLVLSIFHATMTTFDVTPCVKLIENQDGKGWYNISNHAQR